MGEAEFGVHHSLLPEAMCDLISAGLLNYSLLSQLIIVRTWYAAYGGAHIERDLQAIDRIISTQALCDFLMS